MKKTLKRMNNYYRYKEINVKKNPKNQILYLTINIFYKKIRLMVN